MPEVLSFVAVALSLIAIFVAYLYIKLQQNIALVKSSCPGLAIQVSYYNPTSQLGYMFTPDFLLGKPKGWIYKQPVFKLNYSNLPESSKQSFMSVSPNGLHFHTANAEIIKEITDKPKSFPKPIHQYALINIFGENIVGTEGNEWKRHRKVASPQFSEKNNELVHKSTIETGTAMIESWIQRFGDKPARVDVVQDLQLFSLSVFSEAAFGKRIQWPKEDEPKAKPTDEIGYRESIMTVAENMALYVALPSWILPKKIKDGMAAFKASVQTLIERASQESTASENLLSRFVAASILKPGTEQQEWKDEYLSEKDVAKSTPLSKEELLGDVWILLFAGYETTAATLAHTFKIQEELYNEAVRVYGGSKHTPSYSQLSSLDYANAVVHETLRTHGPVAAVPKWTTDPQKLGDWVLPAKTVINIHSLALHNNPAVWKEPHLYNPKRFLFDEKDKDGVYKFNPKLRGFTPFSDGMRSCIGKQFAKVEMVFLISFIASRYTWKLPDGMGKEEINRMLTEIKQTLTHKMKFPSDVIFTKRA